MPLLIRHSPFALAGMSLLPNPIKGSVNIEISGKSYPLVFNYDAIAQIESKYDASILDVALDMSRIEKQFDFLVAALNGQFTIEELKAAKLPPFVEVVSAMQDALHMAYFGDEVPDNAPEAKTKKKRAVKAT